MAQLSGINLAATTGLADDGPLNDANL